MISWYIDTNPVYGGRPSEIYLNRVKETVEPCMNYLCDRLSEVEDYDINDLEILYREIVEELPILSFINDGDEFYFRYNSYTIIRFRDPLKSIKRDILINRLLA